ncbi:hypothetical protein GF407_11840 [candidate division KSB1 bacterium]|nr:hypothetical protein [candidate division KSB1 bacterium]
MFHLVIEPTRIGHPILGYIIPAAIFIISFAVAFLLYRKFTRELENRNNDLTDSRNE